MSFLFFDTRMLLGSCDLLQTSFESNNPRLFGEQAIFTPSIFGRVIIRPCSKSSQTGSQLKKKVKWRVLTFFSLIKYDSDKTNGLQSRKILIIIIIIRKTASHKVFVAWRCCIFWTLNTLTCANFYMKYGRKGQRKVKVVFNTMFILDFYSTSSEEMII